MFLGICFAIYMEASASSDSLLESTLASGFPARGAIMDKPSAGTVVNGSGLSDMPSFYLFSHTWQSFFIFFSCAYQNMWYKNDMTKALPTEQLEAFSKFANTNEALCKLMMQRVGFNITPMVWNKAKWMPTQLSVKKLTNLRAFYPETFGLEDEPNKDFLKSLYYLHISNRTFSGEITPLIEDKDFITHMPYANFVLPIDDFTKNALSKFM